MNYEKIYNNLMKSRENRYKKEGEYYENHHIIPKCLGGSNDKDNIVSLTFREHYIAHLLLTKIHRSHSGINYALLCMIRKQPTGERIMTSKIYENIKRNYKDFKKKHCTLPNPGTSDNSRNSARTRMLDKKRNPISLDPSKNRTAQPIRIYFEDGRTEDYKYAKEFCIKNNVPYATMKFWLKNQSSSKKYGIIKIERLDKVKSC